MHPVEAPRYVVFLRHYRCRLAKGFEINPRFEQRKEPAVAGNSDRNSQLYVSQELDYTFGSFYAYRYFSG